MHGIYVLVQVKFLFEQDVYLTLKIVFRSKFSNGSNFTMIVHPEINCL